MRSHVLGVELGHSEKSCIGVELGHSEKSCIGG